MTSGVVVRSRMRAGVALGVSLLVAVAAFAVWQLAVPAYQRSQPVPAVSTSETLSLPRQVYDPSPHAPSTQVWGPPGPVGLAFQGRHARDGLAGEVAQPWYVVSARTGDYRRLEAPDLDQAQGGLAVSPRGTRIAWSWSGRIACYDTVTGETRTYPVPQSVPADGPLVWSPDASRIAFGESPVRVLDTGSGDVTDLPLRVPTDAPTTPAWTADGQWVTVVDGRGVDAVEVDSGRRRVLPAQTGGLQGAQWNSAGAVAGLHAQATHRVLRVLRTGQPGSGGTRVVEESPPGIAIETFWGWVDRREVVLTGLRSATGPIEQAMALSLPDNSVRTYMLFPTLGDNWRGLSTVSVAGALLQQPTRDFERPALPWSPVAKLLLCVLLSVFPTVYYLVARKPRRG
ncbi:MAG: hypothetical protein M3211_02985 [Actinomycetota bacterium]|nr:hypothetical protein [Actinomycetota bacterium]